MVASESAGMISTTELECLLRATEEEGFNCQRSNVDRTLTKRKEPVLLAISAWLSSIIQTKFPRRSGIACSLFSSSFERTYYLLSFSWSSFIQFSWISSSSRVLQSCLSCAQRSPSTVSTSIIKNFQISSLIMNNTRQTSNRLRATSFKLGSQQVQYLTTHVDHYPPKKSQPVQFASKPPGICLKGQDNTNYLSTHKAQYIKLNSQRNVLDSEKLKALKSHSYRLGNGNGQPQITTNQINYPPKQSNLQSQQASLTQRDRMRAHSHCMDQGYLNRQTAYQDHYKPLKGQPTQLAKRQQKTTPFSLGNYSIDYITRTKQDYVKKQPQARAVGRPAQSHVHIGDAPRVVQTTNNQIYKQHIGFKPFVVDQPYKNQMRKTHFSLGNNFHPKDALSQQQQQFQHKQCAKPELVGSSAHPLILGTQNYGYSTTNKEQLPRRAFDKSQPAILPQSKINLGNFKPDNTTTNMQHFRPTGFVAPAITAGVPSIKQGQQYKLFQGKLQNLTTNKLTYKHPGITDRAKPIKHQQTGLRREGRLRGLTEYMDQFREDQQVKLKDFHRISFRV